MSESNINNDKSTNQHHISGKLLVGLMGLGAAALLVGMMIAPHVSAIVGGGNSQQLTIPQGQQQALTNFNYTGYTNDQLITKVKNGQARVAEAYALEYYFCASQKDVGGSDNFAFAVAKTGLSGFKITADIDCHLKNGDVKQYAIVYDQTEGQIVESGPRMGPSIPT